MFFVENIHWDLQGAVLVKNSDKIEVRFLAKLSAVLWFLAKFSAFLRFPYLYCAPLFNISGGKFAHRGKI